MEQTRWNPTTREDYDRIIGREVYTHDGESIGRVERIVHPPEEGAEARGGHFVVVRPEGMGGPLGADVAYIPESAVALATPDAIELTVATNEIADQGWARLPAGLGPHSAPLPEDVPPAAEGGVYEESHREAE